MSSFVDLMTSFIHGLYGFTESIGFPSYAFAIILLGVIVRILLFPLSLKQMKSTLGMSEIQPELKEVQQKYRSNPEKMNEEMKRLYSEYDVNPAAGCFPILVQMPILYALFRALREYDFAQNASFFWINSLNDIDPYKILPVILAVVMFGQQKLAMPKETMNANASMKMLLYFMPVMMLFFSMRFPAGLCLYWITTSVIMIFLQLIMNKQRKKELAKRAELRKERELEREKKQKEQKRVGQNPNKKRQRVHRARHKARYEETGSIANFNPKNPKPTYQKPAAKKQKRK